MLCYHGRRVSIGHREIVFLVIFSLMALQMMMGFYQFRQYQNAVKKWRGKGILGMGQRRGILTPGEILILVYDRREDRAVSVQSMRGWTIFARFREVPAYTGLSLAELRSAGIDQDAADMRWRRKRRPYDPAELTKKKGALIQAVEAVERSLRRQAETEEAEAEAAEAEMAEAGKAEPET
jgi:glucitol operon activator protein